MESSELSEKLNRLFETMRKPHDPPLSNAAAAAAITESTGVAISAAYLWQLRTGLKSNPTVTHLRAIAEYFGVPASYLIDAGIDPHLDAQIKLLSTFRDAGIRDLATRAAGLTSQSLESIRQMIDQVRRLEELPPIGPSPGEGRGTGDSEEP
ncbi:XRE family transcriptional regulator [Mycobacterium koreense]|uniref:XRE family transcriptional regulator n=1 Tax=Mycolicibacillus koreensis TaxID=1069220 RepID=A0AA91PGU8_9MYCO|nr:XRE family transcriptional regulator [Mycolicibacillus koreensis]OSC34731.1 XRE family transcriptional regulator [Mycolicibacillus koreensis]